VKDEVEKVKNIYRSCYP